jgi:hypothetical protein
MMIIPVRHDLRAFARAWENDTTKTTAIHTKSMNSGGSIRKIDNAPTMPTIATRNRVDCANRGAMFELICPLMTGI